MSGRSRSMQLDARREHEFGQRRAVHGRQRQADEAEHVFDAVFGARRRGPPSPPRSRCPSSLWPSSARSLSLAVTTATLAPGVRERREDRAGAQVLGVVHHHFGAGVAVPEVVAADAVHRRRRAGDDRQVVGIRERRHDAVGGEAGARIAQPREVRRAPGGDRLVDVLGLAAVDADDDERPSRPARRSRPLTRRGVGRAQRGFPRPGAPAPSASGPGARAGAFARGSPSRARTARGRRRRPARRRSGRRSRGARASRPAACPDCASVARR